MSAVIATILTILLVLFLGKVVLFTMIGIGAVYLYNNGEWWGPPLGIVIFYLAVQMWWFVRGD